MGRAVVKSNREYLEQHFRGVNIHGRARQTLIRRLLAGEDVASEYPSYEIRNRKEWEDFQRLGLPYDNFLADKVEQAQTSVRRFKELQIELHEQHQQLVFDARTRRVERR